ncbi:hypothetical protein [Brevibacillus laterosporus]|uniref:hypothetical protein n=1 Tax=Brevibacillus laterosporus TaxID=1465 RepID=UPI001143E391|nr:hypothetical protein [Brevibacillus laterosporus]
MSKRDICRGIPLNEGNEITFLHILPSFIASNTNYQSTFAVFVSNKNGAAALAHYSTSVYLSYIISPYYSAIALSLLCLI